MAGLAVVLVVLTTIADAAALVLQRKAAQDSARAGGAGLRDVARRPAWRLGLAIFVVAVAMQATALSIGSIALVQPVVVMALPFTLVLGWLVLGGPLRRYEWGAVATMSIGLIVLLVALRPQGGDALGAGTAVWTIGSVVTVGALVGLGALASRMRAAPRAALYGVAAGVGSGFVAVIIKVMAEALAQGGPVAVLLTWQTWLLVPVAPMAFLALQHALRAGRLIASQPGLYLGNPLMSSYWGVALLGEEVRGGLATVFAALGAGMIATGVVLLARSPLLEAQESGARVPAAEPTEPTGPTEPSGPTEPTAPTGSVRPAPGPRLSPGS